MEIGTTNRQCILLVKNVFKTPENVDVAPLFRNSGYTDASHDLDSLLLMMLTTQL